MLFAVHIRVSKSVFIQSKPTLHLKPVFLVVFIIIYIVHVKLFSYVMRKTSAGFWQSVCHYYFSFIHISRKSSYWCKEIRRWGFLQRTNILIFLIVCLKQPWTINHLFSISYLYIFECWIVCLFLGMFSFLAKSEIKRCSIYYILCCLQIISGETFTNLWANSMLLSQKYNFKSQVCFFTFYFVKKTYLHQLFTGIY